MIPWSPRRFIVILVALFVLNWLIVAVFAPAEKRIRVPYNPTFLAAGAQGQRQGDLVDRGHGPGRVQEGGQVQGRQRQGLRDRDPDLRQRPRAVAAARGQGRRDQRQAARRAARCSQTILFCFGPTILLVALFVFLVPPRRRRRGRRRRARPVRPQSRAERVEPRRRRSPSTTSPASTRPRRSWSRWSTSCKQPREVPQARGAHPARRAAGRARPAPARRCSPARWRARRACRSSRPRRPSSSRRSWASAPRACATSSSRPKEAAPAIIFIDELDAIGRSRGGRGGGARRPRRARADAQPDPHRDGRLRHRREA